MNESGRKKLIYPLAGLVLLIFIGIAGFYGADRFFSTPISIKDIKVDSSSALKLDAIEQISKKNGITEWELTASSASLAKAQDKAFIQDINVIFHTKEGTTVQLTAKNGVLNTATHDMTFTKDVIVRHRTYLLRSDQLHYEKKAHIIKSVSRVIIEDRDSVIEADSMVAYLNENRLILKGRVKGKFSENFNLP